jgi:HSP20 family protein
MTLVKRSVSPSLLSDKWLSDFFDTDRFFDSDLMKKYPSIPSVNVKESENQFEIEMAAPGLTKKDFTITVDNGVLTIASEKSDEKEEKDNNYTRKEFNYNAFSRSFALPENVNVENIRAHYEDGLLKLSVAKRLEGKVKVQKMIEVK